MNKEQVLQNLGLTKAEVSLYIALLQGEATASTIAKKTNTNRTFTYDRLKKLLELGLIAYVVKDSKKYFKAANPSQLLAILKEKGEQVQEILPELAKLKSSTKQGPEVNIFSSNKGVQTALNNILKSNETVYVHGSMNNFQKRMETYYKIWNARRVKQKVKLKVLSNKETTLKLAESDILPEEEKSSITTFTFQDKVIITLWAETPVAILIESKEIARDSKAFFNAIWDREIKIYSGVDGILKAFFELVQKKTSIHLGIGYSWELAKVYGTRMSDEWHKLRLKNGINSRFISYDDASSKRYFKERMKQWENFNIKFLDKDLCGPACMTLSDHMIATFIYTEKSFKVIVSKNKETIAVYKKHFENLWKKAKN